MSLYRHWSARLGRLGITRAGWRGMAVSRVPPLNRRHVVNQDACVYLVCTLLPGEKKIMSLTPAEKQRRYRNKRKLDPVKDEEARKKALDRYHKTKRLVKDLV
ncbi:uncharacterized protein LOC125233828 [Leguminivora glycinivorella]|uniref:uncharacterized protein LOC125233828 n=1 Tax=Leguminivora glycinivorella TaxID=1035111 RepID=UPI00200BFF88|nr:uncharacterized protein LOC125233828 [Leguminivora glycinivorella]